ncbi:type II toxin-antitoxin system RelE family toxin [Embleya sp. AB8]|uniref:type II toxin-antitoxin system RelE family toxin n=1 Tax=Embleya sp. AB8 TaxID=3156304 RepID=UPI003C715D54
MSRAYRVAYSPRAESEYNAMPSALRRRFDAAVSDMAQDPYACGDPIRGNRDRRSAALAGVITEYEISSSVLTVTMLKVLHA